MSDESLYKSRRQQCVKTKSNTRICMWHVTSHQVTRYKSNLKFFLFFFPLLLKFQEESGETVSSESNVAAEWMCPLCQRGQADRSSLSSHLTEQHSVLPTCVDKLLDIVRIAGCGAPTLRRLACPARNRCVCHRAVCTFFKT